MSEAQTPLQTRRILEEIPPFASPISTPAIFNQTGQATTEKNFEFNLDNTSLKTKQIVFTILLTIASIATLLFSIAIPTVALLLQSKVIVRLLPHALQPPFIRIILSLSVVPFEAAAITAVVISSYYAHVTRKRIKTNDTISNFNKNMKNQRNELTERFSATYKTQLKQLKKTSLKALNKTLERIRRETATAIQTEQERIEALKQEAEREKEVLIAKTEDVTARIEREKKQKIARLEEGCKRRAKKESDRRKKQDEENRRTTNHRASRSGGITQTTIRPSTFNYQELYNELLEQERRKIQGQKTAIAKNAYDHTERARQTIETNATQTYQGTCKALETQLETFTANTTRAYERAISLENARAKSAYERKKTRIENEVKRNYEQAILDAQKAAEQEIEVVVV